MMGICWCKEKNDIEIYIDEPNSVSQEISGSHYLVSPVNGYVDSEVVDNLILETLEIIGTLIDNEQEAPQSLSRLQKIADHEDGWIQVVKSMVHVIPMSDPLGPSVITLLFDDCPLPSKESVLRVSKMFNLSTERAISGRSNAPRERNICVILGCIAEKLAGPSGLGILTEGTLDYLLTNLMPETDPHVILFSLIALEKFAQTNKNKSTILKRLANSKPCLISILEEWRNEEHFVRRQVGFCAQWALDNLFVMENRQYSYLNIDMSGINAMLNTSDVSEYLKISPDGLEARCDAYSFESVRCTAQADSGVWYYEVLIITPGVMQIGWATKNSNFLNHEGYGIGDDKYSLAFDGCRKLIWYNAKTEPQIVSRWQPGDILGCLLDLDKQEMVFSINGNSFPPCTQVFSMAQSGFFAAASFMSFQQCRFNFGAKPFEYPPKMEFNMFNDAGNLKAELKKVLPRHIYLNQLRQQSVREDSCTLCYDKKASVRLVPCAHSGFCTSCVALLTECPMCRAPFQLVIEDNP